jgi:F0F1-type ATP synthase epsilon subunit
MLFLLATPEYTNVQANTTKVKVHLKNGIAEILDKHQDLMGRVENNLVEIESSFENKVEKLLFVVQDAVFIVSTKGLDPNLKGTGVYVYARNVRELNSTLSIDELSKQYEQKKALLETEIEKISQVERANKPLSSKILLLEEDVAFFRKALIFAKELK